MWMLALGLAVAQPDTTDATPRFLPVEPPIRAPADAAEVPGQRLRNTGRALVVAAPALVGLGTGLWVLGRWVDLGDPNAGEALQVTAFTTWGVAAGLAVAAPPVLWVAGDRARQAGANSLRSERDWSIALYAAGAGLAAIGAVGMAVPTLGPGHPVTWTLAAAPAVALASLVVSQVYAERGVRQLRFAMAPAVGREQLGLVLCATF